MPELTIKPISAVAAVCFTYAITRYHGFGNVELNQLPLFISNKAIAMMAATALALAAWSQHGASWGRLSFNCALIHLVLSVLLLDPWHFPDFYTIEGHYTLLAGLALLLGVITTYLYVTVAFDRTIVTLSPSGWHRLIASSVSLHLLLLGLPGWLRWHDWPGGLPPISLLCCGLTLLAVIGSWRRQVP